MDDNALTDTATCADQTMGTTASDRVNLRVAKSPVHGKGLFAENFIKEGDILGVIEGDRTNENGTHVLWLRENYAVRMSCDFRFINHSDEPNVVLYDTLEVCALRDIAAGEEIFHDYDSGDWTEETD